MAVSNLQVHGPAVSFLDNWHACRLECWWEGAVFQLKLLALLLILVNGRPLGVYLQSLMTLLLGADQWQLHYSILLPVRLPHLQLVHVLVLVVLVASVTAGLILRDYENVASQGGLTFVGLLMGLANVFLFTYMVFYTCYMYINLVKVRQLGPQLSFGTNAAKQLQLQPARCC